MYRLTTLEATCKTKREKIQFTAARAQVLLLYDAQSETRGLVTSFETLVTMLLILDYALYNRNLRVGC